VSAVTQRPATLLLAAVLVGAEALALAAQGVLELVHLDADRIVLAVTTTLFFLGLGAGLGLCAWGLAAVRSWARGPVVALQLIGLLTAYSFWGGSTTTVAVVLGLVCLLTLVGVLHPASTEALASAEQDAEDEDEDAS
jgi:peptidoglycan/LPS O-acetylase OafA/YrhL